MLEKKFANFLHAISRRESWEALLLSGTWASSRGLWKDKKSGVGLGSCRLSGLDLWCLCWWWDGATLFGEREGEGWKTKLLWIERNGCKMILPCSESMGQPNCGLLYCQKLLSMWQGRKVKEAGCWLTTKSTTRVLWGREKRNVSSQGTEESWWVWPVDAKGCVYYWNTHVNWLRLP